VIVPFFALLFGPDNIPCTATGCTNRFLMNDNRSSAALFWPLSFCCKVNHPIITQREMKKRINVKSNKTERDGVIPWNYSLLPIRKNYEGKMNHQQKEVTSNHVCYYPEKKL
jgi:hypothetical protein